MKYIVVPYDTYLKETLAALRGPGALLVSAGRDGRPNAMTIGWGTVGTIWDRSIFTVLVRPSRYTYQLIQESGEFTVCLPGPADAHIAEFCGSQSGRDHDKFAELGLAPLPSTQVAVPGIDGLPVIYECRVVSTNDLVPEQTIPAVHESFYAQGNWHRVFYGEILAVRVAQP